MRRCGYENGCRSGEEFVALVWLGWVEGGGGGVGQLLSRNCGSTESRVFG